MKLFLTSAGIVPETTKEFLELLGKDPEKSRLAFIPTAADPETDKWFVEKDKEILNKLGFIIEETDLKNETQDSLGKKFDSIDAVFVEGGDTFYLLDQVRKSGFDKAIKKFLERGGLYIGVSAGSIIAGPTIEPASWGSADKNIVGLDNLFAMNIVPFAIMPHIDDVNIGSARSAMEKFKHPLALLTDDQSIIIDGKRMEIVGIGEKIVFGPLRDKDLPRSVKDIGFEFGWDEKKVWELDLPVIDMDIKELIWHLNIPFFSLGDQRHCLTPMEVINNPAGHQKEYQRTAQADLSYPLDIMENKGRLLLLDGVHRLMKAYIQNKKYLKVRLVPRSKILMIIE